MIKNYKSFLGGIFMNEANVKNKEKVKRSDLEVGDEVMTMGEFDGVNLDYQVGKIIEMKEYGHLLIEFEKSFNDKLHAGHQDIGKDKHCFYVPMDNISSNDRKEFDKIIKDLGKEQKNKLDRLNADYKIGDIVVGVGEFKGGYRNVKVDGEIGIVYYEIGKGNADGKGADKNNVRYWIGFLDKFEKTNLYHDNEGLPTNDAGLQLDKLNIRHATEEEKEFAKDKIKRFKDEIDNLKKVFNVDDIVVANGNYNGIVMKNNIGIVRFVQDNGNGKKYYIVRFLERFSENFYDVNYIVGNNNGYQLPKVYLREITEEELEKNKGKIKTAQLEIEDFNHDYKVGDWIMTHGKYNNINFDGQIGVIKKHHGKAPNDHFEIDFLSKFNNSLQGVNNSYSLVRSNLSSKGDIEDIKKKTENKEILPIKFSNSLSMLLNRMEIKMSEFFGTFSFFDVTDTNDTVTTLPLDRFKRMEPKDDPFKSRMRQPVKIGKFLRMLNKNFTEKEVENYVNSYKASFDICISGLSDKLKLVSGEDVRYWYCDERYVTGGGDLNSSCMKGKNKGPEMQMFVDNPDVIQLLILTDDKNKLLGRALVWKLVEPEGKTFMDYIYTRHDKDKELFMMYAEQRGWLSSDAAYRRGGGRLPDMVCALNTDKKYQMGRNALDHFDTLTTLNTAGNYLTNNNSKQWKRKEPIVPKTTAEEIEGVIKKQTDEIVAPFKEGDKVLYKKEGSVNDGKTAVFVSARDDGKYRIIFDDGGRRFAANAKNLFPVEKEKE